MNLLEFLGLCLLLYSDCVSSTTESACEEISYIFPSIEDNHFKTNNNDTIREKLLERTINIPSNGSEINGTEIKSLPCVPNENSTTVPEKNTTISNSKAEATECIEIPLLFSNFTNYKIIDDPDKRAELEAKTTDVHKSESSLAKKMPCAPKNFDHYKLFLEIKQRLEQEEQPPSSKQKPIFVKVLVGIAASVLSIAILYLGFIKFKKNFRRILTSQNGNREILINEFDDVELQENKFIV